MPPQSHSPSDHIIRLSFFGVVVGFLGILLTGLLGGVVAQQAFQNSLPPLTNNPDQLVTTVQEVTISPNTSVAALLERTNRSVLLLAQGTEENTNIIATGLVLTNDGVVVTTNDMAVTTAFDYEGRSLPLQHLGNDILFGLTYYRIPDNVVVPLDIAQQDPVVGQELLVLTRQTTTFLPRIKTFRINEYSLPAPGLPVAVQRVMVSTASPDDTTSGSPLLNDEGRVAGVLLDASQGLALPMSHLQASMGRLTSGQRELDPFANLGLSLTYSFKTLSLGQPVQFVATVSAVVPGSPAARAGVERGDTLTHIDGQQLDWQRIVASDFTKSLPLPVTIRRGAAETVIVLQPVPSPAAP
ncbi:MAG: PDZ domain-containing protein [Candidatus Andersenbacteria bacterium]